MAKLNCILSLCIGLWFLTMTSCKDSGTPTQPTEDPVMIESEIKNVDLLRDIEAHNIDGTINAVIEITAGTVEKWEVDKSTGQPQLELINGMPRTIDYLPYPANYGMIPQTLLPKEKGGDGDPLDVIVLGPAIPRGQVARCKLIGVLYLTDSGEQDDKLIAVSPSSKLNSTDIDELKHSYNGITDILETWFTNYKGPGRITSKGYGTSDDAMKILTIAIKEYRTVK